MNTQDALLFVRVAESLSFKVAASQLGISRSAASKRIALLEKELGATLVLRNPRRISLTHAGVIVLRQCRIICEAISQAQQAIHGHGMQPVGTLQLAMPTALGASLLPSLLTEFVESYPKVNLSVHLVDGPVDVIGGGYDVALTVTRRLEDSSLRAQRIASTDQVLVASPGYLKRCGVPRDVRELSKRDCLGIGFANTAGGTWRFVEDSQPIDVQVRYALTANSYLVLNLAACFDRGFLYVPELYVGSEIERGRLAPVLPERTRSISWDLYAVYPHRDVPETVKAVIDFIKARIPTLAQYDRWTPLSSRYRAERA